MGQISVRGISVAFDGTEVLHGIDLDVAEGSVVALLGPSGCGKTTLLRSIAGLQRPTGGEVRIGDALVSGAGVHVPPGRRRIGMVFQDWALFPHPSVRGNVAATAWVAHLVGDANLVPGVARTGRASTSLGDVDLRSDVEVTCDVLLRPEDLALDAAERDAASTPVLVEYYGHDTVYLVTLDDGTRVRVREVSVPRFERGDVASIRTTGRAAVAFAAG